MATHSVILPGESPWTEEPGGPQFVASRSQAGLSAGVHEQKRKLRHRGAFAAVTVIRGDERGQS